jgi:hypothetical protein
MTLMEHLTTWAYHLTNRNNADDIAISTQGLHDYIAGLEARIVQLEAQRTPKEAA